MSSIAYQIDLVLKDILDFHAELEDSEDFPTEKGIRDLGLLESAVNAPFQTFAGQDLYPTVFDKAAHLLYGINKNHGFVDGNKRVAIHAMLVYLIMNHIDIEYTQEEIVQLSLDTAENKILPSGIIEWLKKRKVSRKKS